MDKIYVNGMEFYGYHGVIPEENRLGQRFIIDLELELDLQPAGQADDLSLTVDYSEVYTYVQKIVEEKTFKLIEKLAEQLADTVLTHFSKVQQVVVKVTKPHPPVAIHFQGVRVEIRRRREG